MISEIEIQWEDSDVCLTLLFECGEETHFDRPGIDRVRCAACGDEYELPREVEVGHV